MRLILRLLLTISVVMMIAIVALGVSRSPIAAPNAAPTGQDVTLARGLLHQLRRLSNETGGGTLEVPIEALRGSLRMGGQIVSGFRGQAEILNGDLVLDGAIPVPGTQERLWINLRAEVPPFEGAPKIAALQVGRIHLPESFALALLQTGARVVLGADASRQAFDAVQGLSISDDTILAELKLDSEGRGKITGQALAALRGGGMPDPGRIARDYVAIRDAIESGVLPTSGSFTPYLKFALDRAMRDTTGASSADGYTSAIFALAKACGANDLSLFAGGLIDPAELQGRDWTRSCDGITLRGRTDTRRHFVTAAALQAASNRGVSVSIGEFKELFDSVEEANGFDFTDIAANNSGIRFSQRVIATPTADWAQLIATLDGEDDFIVMIDDLPGRLPAAEFAARFGSVGEERYDRQLAVIEHRIDALKLHKGS